MSSSKVVCIGPHKRAKDAGLKTTLLTSSLLPRNTYLRFDRSDPLYIKELNAAKVVKKNPDKIYLCEQFDKRKPMALNSFILWTNYNTLQNLKKKLSRTEVEQEEFTDRQFLHDEVQRRFPDAGEYICITYGIKKLTKELKKLENDLKDVKIIDNLWEDVYETEQVVEQGKLDASISLRSKALESRGLLDNFRKINSLKKPKDQQGENKLRLKEEEEKELEEREKIHQRALAENPYVSIFAARKKAKTFGGKILRLLTQSSIPHPESQNFRDPTSPAYFL